MEPTFVGEEFLAFAHAILDHHNLTLPTNYKDALQLFLF